VSFRYVLDTSVWVAYFDGLCTEEIRRGIENDIVGTSVIALVELADKFERDGRDIERELSFIRSRSILLPVTPLVAIAAAKIKKHMRKTKPKFGIADALHLATAQERKAILLTMDNDFANVKGVTIVRQKSLK